MYFRTNRIARWIVGCTMLCGCDILGSMCDDAAYPAVELTVKNAAGKFVCDQVTAVLKDKTFIDTLRESRTDGSGQVTLLSGADERPGNYTLIITSDEYKTHTDTQIVVRDGQCHVQTKRLLVVVEPK